MSVAAPLRIALLVSGATVPAWVAAVARDLATGSGGTWLAVLHGEAEPADLAWYERLDLRLRPLPLDAHAPTRLELPSGVRSMPAKAMQVADLALDVVLVLAAICPPELAAQARLGAWHLEAPHLMAAYTAQSPITTLQLRVTGGAPRRLDLATVAIDRMSLARTRNQLVWKLAAWVPRCLQAVTREGWDGFEPWRQEPAPPPTASALTFPVRLAAQMATRRARHYLGREEWFIAVRVATPGLPAAGDRWLPIPAPDDRFEADPFLLQRPDGTHLFFESARYADGRGVIAWRRLDDAGRPGPSEVVLQADHHLAYPCVFEHEDSMWMAPDTGGEAPLDLYRAEAFPRGWQPVHRLLDNVRAVDPTLHHDGTRWWLFANVWVAGGSPTDELFLFHADTLAGPWQPHPHNPVVADVRRSRPAGRLFRLGDRWIRPVQDCAERYGHAIAFCEVLECTPERYRERLIGRLDPLWQSNLLATHTYSEAGPLQVVDGQRWRRW